MQYNSNTSIFFKREPERIGVLRCEKKKTAAFWWLVQIESLRPDIDVKLSEMKGQLLRFQKLTDDSCDIGNRT
jgi:hypothetical protein